MAVTTKVFKPGRVVVILNGRHAGKKAVVLTAYDQGNRARSFGHALVVGIEKPPLKVTKKMSNKVIEKRTNIKAFLKHINYSHMMPTRYVVSGEIDTKTLLSDRKVETAEQKIALRKDIGSALKEKFMNLEDGKTTRDMLFFRQRLRF